MNDKKFAPSRAIALAHAARSLAAFAILATALGACSLGLGSEIDLEAPVLAITSHQNLDYVGVPFTLAGTAIDNSKVDRVEIRDSKTGQLYANAAIDGTAWAAEVILPEGDTTVRVSAYDKNNNSSHLSVRQMTFLVDSSPPVIKSVDLARPGGWPEILRVREDLEAVDASVYSNADKIQNEAFTLNAELDDDSNVNAATLRLLDATGTVVFSKVSPASSAFNPSWTVTHAELAAARPDYATGRHYLRVTVETADVAGNTVGSLQGNVDQFLWLCWSPESDKPRINPGFVASGSIVIPKEGNVPVETWDDDALGTVHARLLTVAQWEAVSGATSDARIATLIADTNRTAVLGAAIDLGGTPRQKVINVPVGSVSGNYILVVLAQDSKSSGSGTWSGVAVPTLVTDEDVPVFVVDSPQDNSFPSIDASNRFTISGSVLDNRGASVMRVAWIPNGIAGGANSRIADVEALLKASTLAPGTRQTLSDGIVIRSVSLGASSVRTVEGQTYYARPFSESFDILADFMYQGTNENANKLFVLYTTDEDRNDVWRTFRVAGNKTPPSVRFTNPASDLLVYSTSADFTLEYEVSALGGLPLASVTLQDITNDPAVVETPTVTAGIYRLTKTVASMASWPDPSRRTWRVIARDALGNETRQERTVIFTAIPILQRISSGALNGTYKSGEAVTLTAEFSNPVRVTGTPRLRLRYNPADTDDKYAVYTGGTGTKTLLFTFTVPPGAVSTDLRSHTTPIDLSGGAIVTTEGVGAPAIIAGIAGAPALAEAETLQGQKNIALDGVVPTISSLSITNQWYRVGDRIEVRVALSEPILVTGAPVLTLGGAPSLTATYARTSGLDAIFEYVVASGTDRASITWNLATCISDVAKITDLAGNTLALTTAGTGSSGMIDTIAPAVPIILGPAAGLYNANQTLTLDTPAASGSPETTRYSLNGGLTWNDYAGAVTLTEGSYSIVAKRVDAAGNESALSASRSVEIGMSFPPIVAISCEEPDGVYIAGASMTFKVSFNRTVKTISNAARLVIGNGTNTWQIPVRENATGASVLYFDWASVPASVTMYPVQVISLNLTGVRDNFGNANAAPVITGLYTNRPLLQVDSVAPVITGTAPADGAVLARVGGNSVLTLTFNEDVWVESGTIEVYRVGNWLIPPVMTEAEFASVYYNSALSAAQREALMETENGSMRLHAQTGQPVGPYIKTTHGIKESGGVYVPDTSTKYVLNFERGLDDAAIRGALEAAGYHRYQVDVTSFRVTGSGTNVITITLPTPLPHGREWTASITAGSFRDAGGNLSTVVSAGDWTFWSDKVAAPVIRVDRYSHGNGAVQPIVTGLSIDAGTGVLTGGSIDSYQTIGTLDKTTAPSGYARVRVDSETPGAVVRYGARRYSTATIATGGVAANASVKSANADIPTADMTSLAAGTVYSAYFPVGDGAIDTAGKFYVAASATKAAGGGDPALSASDRSYEAAYKSVIMYRNPGSTGNYTRFQGSNIEGGMPTISGFPMRDADPDLRFTKHSYLTNTSDWYWHSWEIVSGWYNQSTRRNWQTNPNYILNTYGDYLYSNQKEYYGGGTWTDAM